ncbi:MAG: hypothetical protein U0414_43580 [Polyangiaceae bacterium]
MADPERDLGSALRSFARGALLPSHLFGRVVLLLVALRTPAVWLTSMLLRREPVEVTALYRPGGDVQYFEVIGALGRGNFGESNLYEFAGRGLHGFPYGSSWVHDLCFAVARSWGIFVADCIVTILGYAAFVMLARAATLGPRAASAYAGGVSAFLYMVLVPLTDRLGWGRDLIWGERFPRPFLTEIYVALLLSVLLPLATRRSGEGARARPGVFAFAGLVLALLVQSDIYSGFILGLLSAIVIGRRLLDREQRGETVRGTVAMGIAFAATVWPFVLQRRATPPEIPTRWGAYPLTRVEALKWARFIPLSGPIAAAIVGVPAWIFFKRRPPEALPSATVAPIGRTADLGEGPEDPGTRGRVAAFWVAVVVLAAISLPLFFVIVSQGIFPYMFPDRVRRYAMLAVTLTLSTVAAAVVASKRLDQRVWLTRLAGGALVLGMMAGVAVRAKEILGREDHAKTAYRFGAPDSYRVAYKELVEELRAPKYASALVLGTLDQQVHIHWQTFVGRYSFVPDGFTSVTTDAELERRLLLFCRTIGMSAETLRGLLQESRIQSTFFGGKYEANAAFAMAPASDYTDEQNARIRARNLYVSFQFELPKSELARFEAQYEDPKYGGEMPRLDVIVLQRDKYLDDLAPSAEDGWEQTFSNNYFRVYLRAKP